MEKAIMKSVMILSIIFSLHACSTPEERAVVVDSSDSISTSSSMPVDTGNLPDRSDSTVGSDSSSGPGDSSSNNQKMKSFRHTPIDTITSLQDSTKNKN